MKSLFILVLILLGGKQVVHAHALWIESKSIASKNQVETIKVFYGEFSTQEIDPLSKWYADVKALSLWVTQPDQQRVQISLSAASDHLRGTYKFDQEGQYLIHAVHAAKDLGGKTKYVFTATQVVTVTGGSPLGDLVAKAMPLAVYPLTVDREIHKPVEVLLTEGGLIKANTTVVVSSETGWSKSYTSDGEGKISFQPLWKGKYVIEATQYDEEVGTWHEQAYSAVWHGATTFVEVP